MACYVYITIYGMFMFTQPFMYVMFLCLYNHLCHVYMITIYGMLCLRNHLSCLRLQPVMSCSYVYATIYVMFI